MNIFISFKELLQLPSYPFIYKFLFMFCWISFPEAKGSIRLSRVHNLIYGFSYFLLLVVSSLLYVHWNIQSFFLSFVILLLLFAFYTYFRLHICSTSSKYNKKNSLYLQETVQGLISDVCSILWSLMESQCICSLLCAVRVSIVYDLAPSS